jgi:hypothetical protein
MINREKKIKRRKEFWNSLSDEQREERLKVLREKDRKRYRRLTPEKKRRKSQQAVISRRRRDTGVDNIEFEKRFTEQVGLCAICKTSMRPPCQDHDHETNKARELLCVNCNVILGLCLDDEEILVSAIRYLRKHTEDSST